MLIGICCLAVRADFLPSRYYKVRTEQKIDQGWKFYKGDVSGASATSFSDGSWQVVNLPHSAMYGAPDSAGEQASVPNPTVWDGVCWYRLSFTVPSGIPHNQKVFLEFDAAMQSAQVYVNGTLVGTHDACGFTGFYYDVTGVVSRTGPNEVAVRLDCNYQDSIPPGRVGTYSTLGNASNGYPDFYLFSGLYRDVWLLCTDSVYVGYYGQKVSTPLATAAAARVRVRTRVRNDNSVAENVTVSWCVVDSSGTIVKVDSLAGSIPADTSLVFDKTGDTIHNPNLWSPESPYLYKVFTKVAVNGQVVDDYVERFGIRSLSWTRAGGFYLNGARYLLKGVCMHQEFAWVENAVPRSRFFQEVQLVKTMGGNSIRCSHFPRSPAFYNACDELGMVCEVELPSWGCCSTSPYPASFWTRMNTVAQEMITVGYDHPCIILWGIFNEPDASDAASTFATPFTTLNATIKSQDSTRGTALYGSSSEITGFSADVYGMNYELRPTSVQSQVVGSFVSEYYEGWIKWCFRGDTSRTNDAALSGKLSENKFSSDHWYGNPDWDSILTAWNGTSSTSIPAGGHLWSFIDYCSPFMVHPMGVLDQYRIPKKAYYMYSNNWTGAAQDTFIIGLTPTRVVLNADLTNLNADSTDLTRIVASLRDASGRCAFAARPVTLQLAGPVDCFDTLTRTTIAGKIGWILKSRNTPGTITVIGTSAGLTADTITLSAAAPDNSALPFIWPQTSVAPRGAVRANVPAFTVRQSAGSITVAFSKPRNARTLVRLLTMQGATAAVIDGTNRSQVSIDSGKLPSGCYCLCVGKEIAKKIVVANP
jgi:beta-galactosidase